MTAAVIIAALVLVVASVASDAREDSSQLEAGMERSRQQQCGDLLHTPFTLNTGPLEAAREGYCSVPQPRAMLLRTQDHIIDVRGNLAAVNPRARPQPALRVQEEDRGPGRAGRGQVQPRQLAAGLAAGGRPGRARGPLQGGARGGGRHHAASILQRGLAGAGGTAVNETARFHSAHTLSNKDLNQFG